MGSEQQSEQQMSPVIINMQQRLGPLASLLLCLTVTSLMRCGCQCESSAAKASSFYSEFALGHQ